MKISELAKELKPYIVKWINESSGGTISGVANGNFAPTPHSISGYHHSGTLPHSSTWMSGLADDTHIQYASADGSGTRSGYQSERLNKSILSGSGITGGGLLTANQTLTLRTPATNLAASSTNVVNANGHTHAIDAKFDVSATNTADLLKSTASGGLTLKTLDVMGAVDILGGDLTVGSAMTLFVDESGNNVGIAGVPDPQFALDVNGPFHADAIYGPLGRILKDCIFLAHYDGPPGPDDYSGTPQTVQGKIPTTLLGAAATYKPGKYGKALQVAASTVNKIVNPDFGHPTAASYSWATNGTDLTTAVNYSPGYVYSGSNSLRIIRSAGDGGRILYQGLTPGNTNAHFLSAYVKKLGGGAISASDCFLYGDAGWGTTTYAPIGDDWYLLSASIVGSTTPIGVGIAFEAFGVYYYVGGLQLEERLFPTPLAHGSMGMGHAWTSVAYESWTTRASTDIIYEDVVMPPEWSFGFWFKPWELASNSISYPGIFDWYYDNDNRVFVMYGYVDDRLYLGWNGSGSSSYISHADLTRGEAAHIAGTFDGTTVRFYVNGTLAGSANPAGMGGGVPTHLRVGKQDAEPNISGFIDDLYIVKVAQTADDIGAIIDSEVPVAAEVSVTSWYSGGTTPIWVDSDGFWMRDHTGLEVFGWSSVDNKSWGGVTMDAGDNLIGRYGSGSGGWMRWDRSAGQLKLGYSNACSMAFDGSGACIVGKLQMPGASAAIAIGSTPPTASNAGTGIWIDRGGLTALSLGAYQVKINATDGKLYAGNGNVRLDADGIRLTQGETQLSSKIKWYDSDGIDTGAIVSYSSSTVGYQLLMAEQTGGISSPEGRIYFLASNYGKTIGTSFVLKATATESIAQVTSDYLSVTGDHRVGGGLYVGNFAGDPPADSIIADGGIYLGRNANPGIGNVAYVGALKPYKNAIEYTAYAFVPLTTPLTSASWDGDSRSSSPKTLIDLSAVFGAPTGIKAVLLSVQVRDSTSSTGDAFIIFSDDDTAGEGIVVGCNGIRNDAWAYNQAIVPCNATGDIYYQTVSTGVLTLDIVVKIIGYWI